jgi:hypothetical protein
MNIKPGMQAWITVFLFQAPELAKTHLKTIIGIMPVFLPQFIPAENGTCNILRNIRLKKGILPPIHFNFTGNSTAGKWISLGDPPGPPQDGVLPFMCWTCRMCV